MKRFGLMTLCMLTLVTSISAQFNSNTVRIQRGTPSLSGGVQLMTPIGEYNQTLNRDAFGYYGMLMLNLGNSPIEYGAKASFLSNGSTTEDVWQEAGVTSDGVDVYDEVEMKAKSTINQYMGIVRLEPLRNKVQIYGDLMAGMTHYGLRTKTMTTGDFREKLASDRVYGNSTLTYGWAAGMKVELTPGVMIEGRFENLKGGNARYVDARSLDINRDGLVNYELLESTTHTYNFNLGLSLEF